MKPKSSDGETRRALSARDTFYAMAVGLMALTLYVATLQQDLGGPEDTPKFQFVGHALGTPHSPGYPLYVLLSHLFVKLPIRTIAYRANLFSALLAALACALAYLLGRQIGSARWSAFCAALGLATAASFWRSAVFAEVYSLAASMAALTTVVLLAWGARGGAGRLLAAVGVFALGLGNHLTIVGLLPASVLYVLLRGRRALTPRVTAAAGVLLLLGVSQYGFIVLRTYQQAPYLESQASSLSELVGVMTARRFADQQFAFGPVALLTVQVPTVAAVIRHELGTAGLVLLAAGIIAAVGRPSAGAALLMGGAAGMLAMVLNLSGDLRGFITPVMVFIWPLTGTGIDGIRRFLESLRVGRMTAATLAITAAAAVPLANLAANYEDADQSENTADARFFRSLFQQLPNRAAVVAETYWYDMMLRYLLLTGEAAPGREIVRLGLTAGSVREAARGGRRVFVFAGAETLFGAEGLRFERAALVGPPLEEWLRELPRGTVIVGATAYQALPLELSGADRWNPRGMSRVRPFAAFALIVGQPAAVRRDGEVATSLAVEAAALDSPLPPFAGALLASGDERGARVELAGRTIAEVDAGLALGVFTRDGAFSRALTLSAGDPMRVPFEQALYELRGETPCVEVTADAWGDISLALSTGGWIATLPAIGSVVIETAFSAPGAVRAHSSDLLGDAVTRSMGVTETPDGSHLLSTELTRTGSRRPVFRLALDRPGVRARARLRAGGMWSVVTLCAHQPRSLFLDGANDAILRPDFESEAYFGAGWSGVERTPTGPVRRGEGRATLLLPLEAGYAYRVSLDVVAATGTRIDIMANDALVGTCELRERTPCEIALAPEVLREGVSALTLSVAAPPTLEQDGAVLTFQGARIHRRLIDASSIVR